MPLDETEVKKLLPSVSTALVLAVGIGVFEAAALYLGSGLFLNTMGISSVSSIHILYKLSVNHCHNLVYVY